LISVERNIQKSGLVNLAVATVIFLAAFGVTVFAGTLAGEPAAVFLGLGVLVAGVSWFQMRLEENERLEKLEMDELARSRGASLFEAKDAGSFPARSAREQFEKFFVPGFAILLLLLEAGGAWLLWRWAGRPAAQGVIPERAMAALALFGIFALLLFLFGRFFVTIARLEDRRLLRPSANFLLAGAYVCFFTGLGIAGVKAGFPRADFFIARVFCVLLGLLAVETLVTLLLEIYRPRVKGKVVRALYDSRLTGLLAQPESLFTTAAQALDYQFGFKVSETWFFQLTRKSLPALLLAQFAVLLLSTCVVFIEPGEQGVLERFGRLDPADPARSILNPGGHLLWPWPIDQVYRYRTGQIQMFDVGFTPDARSDADQTILWTVAHTKEVNFLVGNTEPATLTNSLANSTASPDEITKVAPVGLIDVSIPVQFQITNVLEWAYQNSGQTNLLQDLATRDLVQYLAGVDLNAVLSHLRIEAAQQLKTQIQDDANRHGLGVKILFVGVQDIHPPIKVAGDYEQVVAAGQQRIADTNNAVADAIQTNALAGAQAFSDVNQAQASQVQTEVSAWARAGLFTNQIAAYDAAPSVYRQRAYFQMFPQATANSRKYILLVTNTHDVVVFDLQDKIRADLMNLNLNPTNSP
jgi:regulator of protease activity HflC (stomatin/prohibitin superfamily)